MAEHGLSEGGAASLFAPIELEGRTEGALDYLSSSGEFANDTWCQELNESTILVPMLSTFVNPFFS